MSCTGLLKWQTPPSPSSLIELTLGEADQMELSLSWTETWLASNQEELGCNQRQINLDSPRSAMVKFLILTPPFNGLTLNFAYCRRASAVFLGDVAESLNEVTLRMPGQIFTDKVKFKKQILIIGFFCIPAIDWNPISAPATHLFSIQGVLNRNQGLVAVPVMIIWAS